MVKAEVFGPGTYDACANKVKKLTGVLLIFHPGCGHCVQMRPEWEEMKRRLSPSVRVMEVDASQMSESRAMNETDPVKNAHGFPTLFLMKNGRIVNEFKGERKAEEMKHFSQSLNKGSKVNTKRRKSKRRTRTMKKRNRNKN